MWIQPIDIETFKIINKGIPLYWHDLEALKFFFIDIEFFQIFCFKTWNEESNIFQSIKVSNKLMEWKADHSSFT